MRIHRSSIAASAALAAFAIFAPPAAGQSVGKTLGDLDLEGFSQTGARSYDDLVGRAVLIEFFAYW